MILIYDGSFGGWLTAVFEVYERKLHPVKVRKECTQSPDIFLQELNVETNSIKAMRVWDGLGKKLSGPARDKILYSFLSECAGIENILLEYVKYIFSSSRNIEENYGHPIVLSVAQMAKKVGREKHRMEAFVRFSLLKDGLFYAAIEPDFNVLPLIMPHFMRRYADQDWLIYDLKRGYGIHYNKTTGKCNEVTIEWKEQLAEVSKSKDIFHVDEQFYQLLWKDYFKSTGIAARKNLKLHIQHVPRRYWRHLTEKMI